MIPECSVRRDVGDGDVEVGASDAPLVEKPDGEGQVGDDFIDCRIWLLEVKEKLRYPEGHIDSEDYVPPFFLVAELQDCSPSLRHTHILERIDEREEALDLDPMLPGRHLDADLRRVHHTDQPPVHKNLVRKSETFFCLSYGEESHSEGKDIHFCAL